MYRWLCAAAARAGFSPYINEFRANSKMIGDPGPQIELVVRGGHRGSGGR
jgi:hypothetical protein